MIYLDNATTTKTRPRVVESILPYSTEYYGSPFLVCDLFTKSRKTVNHAREIIARSLGAKINEIYFTAGNNEVGNWALVATAETYKNEEKHIIITKIEHHVILHTCQYLEKRRYEVTYLDVDEDGMVKLGELRRVIWPNTILISVMFINSEVSTIESIKEIEVIARGRGVLLHTDTVQAFTHVPIDVDEYNIDVLGSSGHKLNGPEGIRLLYIRTGIKIRSFIRGGAQKCKHRARTENMPGIAGYGKTVELTMANTEERTAREMRLRGCLMGQVMGEMPFTRVNGSRASRLPDNVNFAFQSIEGEFLLIKLDTAGICGSSGSTRTPGSLGPSHMLLVIGLLHEVAHGSLRLTSNEKNAEEEMDYVAEQIKNIMGYLRGMSSLYEDYMKRNDGGKR